MCQAVLRSWMTWSSLTLLELWMGTVDTKNTPSSAMNASQKHLFCRFISYHMRLNTIRIENLWLPRSNGLVCQVGQIQFQELCSIFWTMLYKFWRQNKTICFRKISTLCERFPIQACRPHHHLLWRQQDGGGSWNAEGDLNFDHFAQYQTSFRCDV